MAMTPDRVREMFKGLENGDGAAFFEHVADDVDWTVMGTHPLAGHYRSKQDFIAGTFAKLGQVLPQGAQLYVEHLLVKDDEAVVELHSLATGKNGMRFDNRYCWVVYFRDGVIVRVRAYLDSAMVARLFEENPIAREQVMQASVIDSAVFRDIFGTEAMRRVWSQHLIVLLDPAAIVDTMHDAYANIDLTASPYRLFLAGPSATGDIEGVIIHGAQGARSLTVLLLASARST